MNVFEIKKIISEIIYEFILDNKVRIEDSKSLIEDYHFDSLMLIEFIVEIEKRFGITFKTDDDINALVSDTDVLAEFILNRSVGNE